MCVDNKEFEEDNMRGMFLFESTVFRVSRLEISELIHSIIRNLVQEKKSSNGNVNDHVRGSYT